MAFSSPFKRESLSSSDSLVWASEYPVKLMFESLTILLGINLDGVAINLALYSKPVGVLSAVDDGDLRSPKEVGVCTFLFLKALPSIGERSAFSWRSKVSF